MRRCESLDDGSARPLALLSPHLPVKIRASEAEELLGNHRASYLTAWPSRDLIRAGRQQITKEWWQTRREHFDLYISQFVLDEAAAGDAEAARERLAALHNLPLLDLTDEVGDLSAALVTFLALPAKAATDAAHIANAEMAVAIETACRERGFSCPVICTPEELMGV